MFKTAGSILRNMLNSISNIYDHVDNAWENDYTRRTISSGLFLSFLLVLLLSLGVHYKGFTIGKWHDLFDNLFFCIEVVFTLLLIIELLGVVFVLPKSVAKSVGKQLELLSLIFLRTGFKEFSHISHLSEWEEMKTFIIKMLVYAGASLVIFAFLGLNSHLQKHIRISQRNEDQQEFIHLKKLLALCLLVAFSLIGMKDVYILFKNGIYLHSFNDFYTVLIFADIMILLIALQYRLNYYKIFRYSAFVLATILIRVALSLHFFYDILIGIFVTIFVVCMTFFYNYFLSRKNVRNKTITIET